MSQERGIARARPRKLRALTVPAVGNTAGTGDKCAETEGTVGWRGRGMGGWRYLQSVIPLLPLVSGQPRSTKEPRDAGERPGRSGRGGDGDGQQTLGGERGGRVAGGRMLLMAVAVDVGQGRRCCRNGDKSEGGGGKG
jgi:hypothetical protein